MLSLHRLPIGGLAARRSVAEIAEGNGEPCCVSNHFQPFIDQTAGEHIRAEPLLSNARQQLSSTVVKSQAETWTYVQSA